jgi:hypothetical protein
MSRGPSCLVHLAPDLILPVYFWIIHVIISLSPWSTGQSSWPQTQRSRVPFPALADIVSSSGFGTGSAQPHEDNWGCTWMKKQRLRCRKLRLTAVRTRCADHATLLYLQNLALNSTTSGSRSVGIVRLRTKIHGAWSSLLTIMIIICKGLTCYPPPPLHPQMNCVDINTRSRHEQSSPSRKRGSLARILLKAWTFTFLVRLCCAVQVEVLRRADPPPTDSFLLSVVSFTI